MGGVELQLDLTKDLPFISCDPAQIEQVFVALIMNAIDAMPQGGTLWLEDRLINGDTEIEIKVRDNGTGISVDVLPHIFEPFLTTKESGGVGLGLAIARGIMERHNGRIEVQSELGRGTTFILTLPSQSPNAALVSVGSDNTAMKAR
jgi:signal transduction histidine kinase